MDHEKGNGITGDAAATGQDGSGGQADYGSAGPQVTGSDEGEESEAGTSAGAGIGDDPGAPGGMGGVRGGMPNPDHRPNGGVSPMQGEPDRD
jgi:hypothetical protein